MIKERYLTSPVLEDLSQKMVFIGGPRQVGKTTFAREIVSRHFKAEAYFNWDNRTHRKSIMDGLWPGDADLIILDEIHKYKKWKTLVKGYYDVLKTRYSFLITGSARLDIYRKGGDSMLGRYHYYRLHPFSLAEVLGAHSALKIFRELAIPDQKASEELISLDKFGGFPEPLIKQNSRTLRRWHNEKADRLFREDIRDIHQIRDIYGVQRLGDILPDRAGSQLSINSLREDIDVSHRAVSNWMNVLESFYYSYRIFPFASKRFRALKKEPKLYLWDWSEIPDDAARFENCVGSHLLKLIHFLQDYEGYRAELHYLRSIEKKEVDFLVTINGKPWFAVEVKLNDTNVAKSLHYFKKKLDIPFCYQVVRKSGMDIFKDGIRVVSADRFLLSLK
jgi:predicted AAA+ superfamily ATPase